MRSQPRFIGHSLLEDIRLMYQKKPNNERTMFAHVCLQYLPVPLRHQTELILSRCGYRTENTKVTYVMDRGKKVPSTREEQLEYWMKEGEGMEGARRHLSRRATDVNCPRVDFSHNIEEIPQY